MTLIDDFREFQEMEEDFNLFDIEIGSVKIWERIRFRVYTAIERRVMPKSKATYRRKRRLDRIRQLLIPIINFRRNPYLSREKNILFMCKSRRVLEKDGYWWEPYTDLILQKCEMPYIVLESSSEGKHLNPAKTRKLRYFDFIDSLIYFKIKLGLSKVSILRSESQVLLRIHDEIKKRFNVMIDLETLVRRVLSVRKASLPLYRRLLNRIKPSLVVLTPGYSRENIIEACKSLDIKIAELQHGMIYPFHSGYEFVKANKKENFVDYILTWGDYWRTSANFPIEKENIVSVGFPYIEKKRNSLKHVSKKKQIVFISQDLVADTIIKYALTLCNDQELDYEVFYKLHPGEETGWKEKYPELSASAIKVIDSKSLSLYDLFAESMIQVGVCSTALYEGLAFGLQSYVLDANCVDLMDDLIKREYVVKVTSPDELLLAIKDTSEFKPLHSEPIFKENAVENIIKFLKRFKK